MPQRTTAPSAARRAVATIAAVATLLTISAAAAFAASDISNMVEVASTNGDLNSGALEWSGATYNAANHTMFVVDDETNAYEFDLLQDGTIDPNAPVRVLSIALGNADWEGVAWLSDQQYAMVSEATGVAYIVDVPTDVDTISTSNMVWQFTAGGPDGNSGTEGIAVGTDGSFYVTDEMPSSVSKYTAAGVFEAEIAIPELGDASGVVAANDDSLIVISDLSAKAIHVEFDWVAGTYTIIDEIDLGAFSQLEGVSMIGNEQLHFWGELKGGQTYSHRVGTIVVPVVEEADVNCSGDVDITDALYISQIEVGTAGPIPGCGGGDSNNDGATNVIDALVIAQCEVGISNPHCS